MAYTALSDIRVLSHRQTKQDRLYVAVDKAIQKSASHLGHKSGNYKTLQKRAQKSNFGRQITPFAHVFERLIR